MHYGELEASSWGSESCVGPACLLQWHLPESLAEIKDGDVFGSSDLLQQVLNSWHGVNVKLFWKSMHIWSEQSFLKTMTTRLHHFELASSITPSFNISSTSCSNFLNVPAGEPSRDVGELVVHPWGEWNAARMLFSLGWQQIRREPPWRPWGAVELGQVQDVQHWNS